MNKKSRISILGAEFKFSFTDILILLSVHLLGLLTITIIDVNISESVFSPFTPLFFADILFAKVFHSFLYFLFFPIVGLFLGTSFFGFLFVPILVYLKGAFGGFTILHILENEDITTVFFNYGILLSVETAVLLIFLIQIMYSSLNIAKNSSEDSFRNCFRQSALVFFIMSLLATILCVLKL